MCVKQAGILSGLNRITLSSKALHHLQLLLLMNHCLHKHWAETRVKKCGLPHFLLLFIQSQDCHSSDNNMFYRRKKIHQNSRNIIYTEKKNPIRFNKSTIEPQLSLSHQHNKLRVGLNIFQKAACVYNYSIWLKSVRDKNDAWISSQPAKHCRAESHSEWTLSRYSGSWAHDLISHPLNGS